MTRRSPTRPAPPSVAIALAVALVLAASSCSRDREAPAPPATAPPRAAAPPGSGPPPSTVPSTAGPERRSALAIGAMLPEEAARMVLPVAGGDPIALGQARRDKGLLVVFTCNTCPYAKAWEKRLVALGNEHAALGLGIVFVNSNDPAQSAEESLEAMARRVAERGHRFPYAADATGAVAKALGAGRTPEAFLFGASGALVYHGAVDDNAQDESRVTAYWLKDALAATIAGLPAPVTETKALGCAIKFAPAGGAPAE